MGSTPIGISGSRAAAVLGLSPWATPFSVWQDIMESRTPGFNAAHGYDYTAFDGNASTRWGLAFEDAIIRLAEGKAGLKIGDRELTAFPLDPVAYIKGDAMPFVTCHIDGLYMTANTLHEGKTTNAYSFRDKWGEPGTDKIPIEYQIQVQHQMLCTGADSCIVSVLVFPKRPDEWEAEGYEIGKCEYNAAAHIPHKNDENPYSVMATMDVIRKDGKAVTSPYSWALSLAQMGFFHQYTVKADPDLHSIMLSAYREWWEKYVIGETPPEPESYDDIRSMITAPVGTIIVDKDTARWFKEYKDIGKEISATGRHGKRREQLKTMILDHARSLESTLDDESTDKWVFMDERGRKLGSYGRTKTGMMFR